MASRRYPRLRLDELLTADRNFYSRDAREPAAGTGAALLWRAPAQLGLPVVTVLPDGSYLSVLVRHGIRRGRRAAVIAAARAGQDTGPGDAHLVRVVGYTVPDREGSGSPRAA